MNRAKRDDQKHEGDAEQDPNAEQIKGYASETDAYKHLESQTTEDDRTE